jgi:hypothetical protein
MFRNRLFYSLATLALLLAAALTIRNATAAPAVVSGEADAGRKAEPAALAAGEAALMVGARYTAMSLYEYERTGNRNLLPECITPEILALLPSSIGDNRWQALVPMCGAEATQKAADQAALMVGARYTGLAIQEYVRTGNRDLLPRCISPAIMALLPSMGDDAWRSEVALCGE